MLLTKEQKAKFARIMFSSQGSQKKQIDLLSEDELQKMRSIYAQKIAYESVNGQMETYYDDQIDQVHSGPRIPSLLTSICFCCYPEHNRDYFDITTTVFLKRLFYPIMFWNNGFFAINDGKPQKYGLVWMITTYTIILGLSSSLNAYFIEPQNYTFQNEVMMQALGVTVIFKVAEPLVYSGVIGCLGGYILSNESLMLSSYSLILYFIPTLFCVVPSLYWHVMMVAIACVIRTIFLFRNYSTKMQSRTYLLLIVIIVVQAIFLFIMLRVMFSEDAGYGFTDGFNAVFGETPKIQTNTTQTAHMTFLRPHLIGSRQHRKIFQTLRNFDI